MDLESLKRRDLQALCKKNNIPANITNAAMVEALKSLENIEDFEKFSGPLEAQGPESPDRCVITSPKVPPTSTHQKTSKIGLECSNLGSKTHYGTRKAIQRTDTRKTSTIRTTRLKATQESSVQRKVDKVLQAKFEEDLYLTEVSMKNGVDLTETSEMISGLSVDLGGQIPLGSQSESKLEVNSDAGEIVDAVSNEENLGESDIANEAQEESTDKLDFHSLGRKDLQNLCKKNKIPANVTNVAMADALGSLVFVEGLDEFLKEYDPLALKSPGTSRMASSRARQARGDWKTTQRKCGRAAGSLLCKSLTKTMEDRRCSNTGGGGLLKEMNKSLQSDLEEKTDLVDCIPEYSDTVNSVIEEISNEVDTSLDAYGNGKELQVEIAKINSEGTDSKGTALEMRSTQEVKVNNYSDDQNFDEAFMQGAYEAEAERFGEDIGDNGINEVLEPESDAVFYAETDLQAVGMIQEAPASENEDEGVGDNGINEVLEPESDAVFYAAETDIQAVGMIQEAPASENEDVGEFSDYSLGAGNAVNEDVNAKDESNITEDINKDDEMDPKLEDSKGAEDINIVVKGVIDLKSEDDLNIDPKLVANCNEDVNTKDESNIAEDITTLMKDDEMDPKLEDSKGVEAIIIVDDINLKSEGNLEVDPKPVAKSNEDVNTKDESNIAEDITTPLMKDDEMDPKLKESKSVEDINVVVKGDIDLKSEDKLNVDPKPAANCAIENAPNGDGKGTPLEHKSLRELKRLVKQRLQETDLLAKKMEMLSLKDYEIVVDRNSSDIIDKSKKVSEAIGETGKTSDGLDFTTVMGSDLPSMDNAIKDVEDEEDDDETVIEHQSNESTMASKDVEDEKYSGSNEVTIEESEPDTKAMTFPLEFSTPVKSSRNTSSKSPFKTPISAAMANSVLSVNKENVGDNCCKTEPGKIKVVLTSGLSMGKLKKEVKVLLQQSEKKRTPLQSRSDNQFGLTSP